MSAPDLSIIIPAYHGSDLIASSLDQLADWLDSHPHYGQVEVIVISEGEEATGKIAEAKAGRFGSLQALYPKQRLGKGGAVRLGMFEATGRYRLFMDYDLATPLKHLDDVTKLMHENGQVGIAVRNLLIIHKQFTRKWISKISNWVIQLIVLPGIKDTQCGFKVFSAKAAEDIFSRQTLTSWSFDVEVLAIAKYLGYKIEFFEAPDWHDPKAEEAGLAGESPLKIALSQMRDPIRVRWNLWTNKYRKPSYKHDSQPAES